MSAIEEKPDDVISLGGSSNYEPKDQDHGHEGNQQQLTPGQKRIREDHEASDSDGYSPAADIDPAPRSAKRAKVSTSPPGRISSPLRGSEEGEIEESDDDANPRAALEKGKEAVIVSPATTSSRAAAISTITTPSSPSISNKQSNSEPVTDQAEFDELEPCSGATMPPMPPVYEAGSLSLGLPMLSAKKQGSWPARIKDWVQVLCQHNWKHISGITPVVAMDAFSHYLDQHSGLRPSKRKAAKQAAKKVEMSRAIENSIEAVKSQSQTTGPAKEPAVARPEKSQLIQPSRARQVSNDGSAEEGEVSSNAPDASPPQEIENTQNGAVSITHPDAPTGDDELEQQRRYFPSAVDPSSMCLLCGSHAHRALHCSRSKCRFCNSYDHWDFCCSSIQERCDKCRQLGHKASDCAEKLVLTQHEGLACAYCHSSEHLESNCTEVWRSFQPEAQPLHTVTFLTTSCAVCGGEDHYSGDCRQRKGVSANPTWTLRNRNLYLDPSCDRLCIEESADPKGSKKSARAPEVKIRGHAARTTNVHYSESDDSDTEFLGRRPVGGQKGSVGQIRMSSNIQLPQMMGNHRVNSFQPLAGQPPLPPGPPPPRPSRSAYDPSLGRRNDYHAQPPPNFSSLPSKPPPARDHQSLPPPLPGRGKSGNGSGGSNRGRGGGGRGGRVLRGGRGGRGRGRGR